MGLILTIRSKYQCCVDDSNFDENEEEINTPRQSLMKEPFKLTENIVEKIDSFRTTVESKKT